jgi:DNA-binding HxlR family transcriptional regulator
MTSKVLAKELKDLEEHKLIQRRVYDGPPVLVEYTPTEYADSLQDVLQVLRSWGQQHRIVIMGRSQTSDGVKVLELEEEIV